MQWNGKGAFFWQQIKRMADKTINFTKLLDSSLCYFFVFQILLYTIWDHSIFYCILISISIPHPGYCFRVVQRISVTTSGHIVHIYRHDCMYISSEYTHRFPVLNDRWSSIIVYFLSFWQFSFANIENPSRISIGDKSHDEFWMLRKQTETKVSKWIL